LIKIWTRGQNLAQKSKFSELPQNEQERSPHHHEPNATQFGSNRRHMREISRSVRITKQVKKMSADCAVRTDADVAEDVRQYTEVAYDDVAVSDWYLLEYIIWCAHFTIDDTLVTQPQAEASLRAP
jgi:hypothetical protein